MQHTTNAELSVSLAAGTLSVRIDRSDLPLKELCGFASRRNPKRPFLFVSRVLGRHLPVRPRVMRMIHRRLAGGIGDIEGPALVIGMAETAVGLGQGVYDALSVARRRNDVLFLHSTRYRLDHPLLSTFEESHSHATSHLLHTPANPADAALVNAAQTLVLVDDEASTGTTFLALAQSCREQMPRLSRIVCLTITDWMGTEQRQAIRDQMPCYTDFVSLMQGAWHFEASDVPPPAMPNVTGNGGTKDHLLPRDWGRLGMRRSRPLPAHVRSLRAKPGERILVLGTGEFVHPPFQLARYLAAQRADVFFQASTRSPILEGHDIGPAIEFRDAYEDDIPNFVYGVHPGQYQRVFVCYETPPSTAQHSLIDYLAAEPVYFSHGDD